MCGIFGIVSTGGILEASLLEKATLSLLHRGPDDFGYFKDHSALLGHRRLSIIDFSTGHQPIFNEDGSKCIIFNGEIYNHLALREELVRQGHQFTTRSDTETILHAYEEWGQTCVERLRGMFAFGIWDRREKSLFLARDRLGIKPLFFADYKGRLYFASEMKAILSDQSFPRDMDELGLACYFNLSYIPAPLTIFSGIKKLLPGYTLTWKKGEICLKKFWDLSFIPNRSRDEKYFIDRFLEMFYESVKIRLMSEVPLGAFLSGGIDSSAVVAMMSQASSTPVNTFCIGFGGNRGGYLDERPFAKMIAKRYGTNHREYEVLPEPRGLIEKIVRGFDEPFADDSTIPSYFVCRVARQNVTVALSGLGGDEAFGGYERYLGFNLRRIYNRLPGFLREKVIRNLVERLPERSDGHYTVNHMKRFVRSASQAADLSYFGYLSILNSNTKESLFSDSRMFNKYTQECISLILDYFNSSNVSEAKDSLSRVLFCDAKTYLPEDILAVTDRMSMLHSMEVRVPFVDHELVEFCATIPPEMKMRWLEKKHLLKKATRSLLPREVIEHRKQGFVGPMSQWLKNDLRSFTVETLSKDSLRKHDLLNYHTVRKILDEHFSGKEIHDTLIWSMLVFQTWYDLYVET